MSSCERIGVGPAMDMPEVLKSLLEHSLPWADRRTGRSPGELRLTGAPHLSPGILLSMCQEVGGYPGA